MHIFITHFRKVILDFYAFHRSLSLPRSPTKVRLDRARPLALVASGTASDEAHTRGRFPSVSRSIRIALARAQTTLFAVKDLAQRRRPWRTLVETIGFPMFWIHGSLVSSP